MRSFRKSFSHISKKKTLWSLVIGISVIISISVAGLWLYQVHKNSLGYAVEHINLALEKDDLVLLSNYIDFTILSKEFVKSILKNWPNLKVSEARKKELEDTVQQVIFRALKNKKEESGLEDDVFVNTPSVQERTYTLAFDFLPKDFVSQLKEKKLSIYREDDDVAILNVPITHHEAGYTTKLDLLAQRIVDRWKVTQVLNSFDLVKMHMDALDQKNYQVEHDITVRNEKVRKQMNKHYYVSDCKVFLRKEDNKDADVPITIAIGGANMGTEPIRSAGLRCFLYDMNKNILAVLPLYTVKRVQPGDFFEQEWYMELPESALGHSLLLMKENPLTCSVEVTTLVLDDGNYFYLIPTPEQERIHP